MNFEELLSKRIHMPEIKDVVSWASGSRDNIAILWSLVRSEDRMTSVNALWSMTHLPEADAECLMSLHKYHCGFLLRMVISL